MDQWFKVESDCQILWFRLSEVVGIETPNWPEKPAGWYEAYAALVMLRNRQDMIPLTSEQWDQLRGKLIGVVNV